MAKIDNTKELEELANALKDTLTKTLKDKSFLTFDKPTLKKKSIMEYEGKLRITGMDALNEPSFISAISFYRSDKDKKSEEGCGAVVLYMKVAKAEEILKSMGHKKIEIDDEKSMFNACGEFCKLIVDNFKKAKGLGQLIDSDVVCYRNTVPFGIDFGFDQFDKYEICVTQKEEKVIAFDLTLSSMAS